MSEQASDLPRRRRRPRYSGTHPRRFADKYKEHQPELYPGTIAKVLASGKTPAGAHRPIMVKEIIHALRIAPGQFGVDCTLGHGGHASEILKRLQPHGRLIGIDADPHELQRTVERLRQLGFGEDSFKAHNTNFAALAKVLADESLNAVDFILADLGVSSMQLDNPERGFSYKLEGPLDLRMNPQKGESAAHLLGRVTQDQLAALLEENADEMHARLIASEIVSARNFKPITTTTELTRIIQEALRKLPSKTRETEGDKAVRRVFQALRIAVNGEFAALEHFLRVAPASLNPGGRIAILTFHSGEDRRVKKSFQELRRQAVYSAISEEPIRPDTQETRENPRSASAKLRWAEKGKNT